MRMKNNEDGNQLAQVFQNKPKLPLLPFPPVTPQCAGSFPPNRVSHEPSGATELRT